MLTLFGGIGHASKRLPRPRHGSVHVGSRFREKKVHTGSSTYVWGPGVVGREQQTTEF